MPSSFVFVISGLATTYIFLRTLAFLTHDSREPKAVTGMIPFISPLLSMTFDNGNFYNRMRDKIGLPVYTLRMPGARLYIVNSLTFIQRLDRHIMTVAFCPIQARACEKAMGVSKEGMATINNDRRLEEDGYLRSFARFTAPGTAPGPGLDDLTRAIINDFVESFDSLAVQDKPRVQLFHWIRHEIFAATMSATYGPRNPFKNPKNEQAWHDFEPSIITLMLGFFPGILARKACKARDILVSELTDYFNNKGYLDGSKLVQLRHQHNTSFGLSNADIACTEVGQVAGGVVNTVPTIFWLLWHILSDPDILQDCYEEVSRLVETGPDGATVDLSKVNTACPKLLSTWQEVLRYRGISVTTRIVQEDTLVDNQYLLKKGGIVMMPNSIIHSDKSLWGSTVDQFDHRRFLKTNENRGKRHPAAAFRGFGSGHVLCPGRHLASTQALAFAALVLLRFDVSPVGGKWAEPLKEMVKDKACPLPKVDVEVELIPKRQQKWNIIFGVGDVGTGISIVAEDMEIEDN